MQNELLSLLLAGSQSLQYIHNSGTRINKVPENVLKCKGSPPEIGSLVNMHFPLAEAIINKLRGWQMGQVTKPEANRSYLGVLETRIQSSLNTYEGRNSGGALNASCSSRKWLP